MGGGREAALEALTACRRLDTWSDNSLKARSDSGGCAKTRLWGFPHQRRPNKAASGTHPSRNSGQAVFAMTSSVHNDTPACGQLGAILGGVKFP